MENGIKRRRMLMKNYIFMLPVVLIMPVLLSSCTVSDMSGSDVDGKKEIRFYNAGDPGIWESEAASHDAEIIITRVDDKKVISVQVPFSKNGDRRHYAESILILDIERNILQKRSYTRGLGVKPVKFEFPDDFDKTVYVVISCNKHGLWEKLVDWNE